MKYKLRGAFSKKRWLFSLLLLILLSGWTCIPLIRTLILVANISNRSTPQINSSIPAQEVHFTATDGVHLGGWLVIASSQSPTLILVHGFKGSRVDMVPWAQLLYRAHYNVLLYDSRGCGESEGWNITLGAHEPDDIIGAVRYLEQRTDLKNKHFGALGVSLGAGAVLLAAAREPALQAVVADSAWADESRQLDRMDHFSSIPLLPYEPLIVNNLIGADLAAIRPLDVISKIAPRAVMLIHSADDTNTTTPLSGEQRLYQAAHTPKEQWIAPSGGHAGALYAHPADYKEHILAFFSQYLNKT